MKIPDVLRPNWIKPITCPVCGKYLYASVKMPWTPKHKCTPSKETRRIQKIVSDK